MKETSDPSTPRPPAPQPVGEPESLIASGRPGRSNEPFPVDGQACLLDEAGRVTWINASWQRNGSPLPILLILGDSYPDACRKNQDAFEGSGLLATAVESLLNSATENFKLEIAYSFIEASMLGTDSRRHCLVRGQAIMVADNRCVIVFHEDLTESRLASAHLQASEQRYRGFFEAAPDAVFLLSGSPDDNGRILDANNKAAETHGYTRAELLTMSIGDLDGRKDAALVRQRIATLFAKGSITFEATHRRRDGSLFPVEVSARTATIGGKPCIVSFNRDSSQRHQFEDALRENNLRIDLAARASKIGFWHWDLRENSVMFSPEWKAQIGYEPHEVDDNFEEWRSRVHPEEIESLMDTINQHIQGATTEYTLEFRFRHKDGSYRWIFVRAAISRDEHSTALRIVGCHVDMTASKQADEEREQLRRRLNQLQRIESMGTLAGGIAHDFNNILSIISGNVELALLEPATSPATKSLTEILKASERAAALVRQILSFNREEAPARRHVKLGLIIDEALRLLRSTTPHRIQMDRELAAPEAMAYADPEQLHQVLVNLGTNACHAIGEGTGRVTFRLTSGPVPEHLALDREAHQGGNHAIIEITDDGEGMDDERQSRIFDPFFTTKETGKGTGLGLSVVHGIVTRHGGTIGVQSEPGVGTTFRIYLPQSVADAPAALPTPSVPSGNGRHILLVDDEPDLLRVLGRGLQRYGFKVTAHADPREAIEAVRNSPVSFDALVTDFDMPGINGIEAARIMRALHPGLPVLLCSGFMDTRTSTEASEAGITRLLTKPIRVEQLAQAICDLLVP